MRIVLLCLDGGVPLGGPKGCSVHLRAVAEALLGLGHSVHAMVAEAGPESGAAPLLAAGLRVSELPEEVETLDLAVLLAASEPDLVIERLALLAPQGAQACARIQVPHLYEVNAPLDEEAAAHRGLSDPEPARAAFRAGFAASTAAVAVSDEVAAWARRLAPRGFRVEVLPNGAHRRFFEDPDPAASAHARRTLGRWEGFRVGFVGSFRPWHDLETLLRAVARVRRLVPTQLALVGDGPSRNQLLRSAIRLSAPMVLVGRVAEEAVPAYLAACDAVAIPYASATAYFSPLKLIEAMAAGRAVVASATGPCSRLVRDGFDGLLVPCGEVEPLAAALQRLAFDPSLRERLGAAARARASEGWRWEDVVGRLLDLAREVMPRRAAEEKPGARIGWRQS